MASASRIVILGLRYLLTFGIAAISLEFGACVMKCILGAVIGETATELAYNVHEQVAIKAVKDAAEEVGSKCLARVAGVAGVATTLRDAGLAGSCSADCL